MSKVYFLLNYNIKFFEYISVLLSTPIFGFEILLFTTYNLLYSEHKLDKSKYNITNCLYSNKGISNVILIPPFSPESKMSKHSSIES